MGGKKLGKGESLTGELFLAEGFQSEEDRLLDLC